jgi:hypothetical protein
MKKQGPTLRTCPPKSDTRPPFPSTNAIKPSRVDKIDPLEPPQTIVCTLVYPMAALPFA